MRYFKLWALKKILTIVHNYVTDLSLKHPSIRVFLWTNVKVDSKCNKVPAKLEKWQRAICNVCETILIDVTDPPYTSCTPITRYNVCKVCKKLEDKKELERQKELYRQEEYEKGQRLKKTSRRTCV